MDELALINRCIAQHWCGDLNTDQEAYLDHMLVCLGQLAPSAAEMSSVLASSKSARENALCVLELNRRYLSFARLASKDAAAGRPEILIKLGITAEQAAILAGLNDDEIALLALVWRRPIIEFATLSFAQGTAMPGNAARLHATAFIAASLPRRSKA